MEGIKHILLIVAEIIEILGVLILIYGFVKYFVKFIWEEVIKNKMKAAISILQSIRCGFGVYVLLALDFLIASDIILSISDLSQEQLIRLSVMVVLRTTIGYFLGKEIEEINELTEEKKIIYGMVYPYHHYSSGEFIDSLYVQHAFGSQCGD